MRAASANSASLILVVDPDPLARDTVATQLERAGYCVWTAASSRHALELIGERHPDLALLELRLPDISGCELARLVHIRGIWLPMVLMGADPALSQLVGQVGALTYLPKPFTAAELLRVVGHYCPLGQRRPRRKTSLAVRLSNGAEDLVSPQLSPALG